MKNLIIFPLIFLTCSCLAQNSFLDSSFANTGIIINSASALTSGGFTSIVIQPDHKIIVAGAGQGHALIMRYNEDGTLDPSFASGGIYMTPGNGAVLSLALQPDGKVVTGGLPNMRLHIDGTLDITFGTAGLDTFGGAAIALQTDGKILLTGGNGTYIDVVRLKPDGKLDSTFGVNGIVYTNTWSTWAYGWGEGIAVLPDSKIMVGGVTSLNGFIVMRLLPNGEPDTTFNHTGVAINYAGGNFNYCHAMQVQADGKVVLAGSGEFGSGNGDFALLRYNTDGSLDRSYGDTGVAHVDFNGSIDEIWALCKGQHGKMIGAGYAITGTTENFALSRIDINGKIDSTFGNNGRIITPLQDSNSRAHAIAMQYDGKVILGGFSKNWTGYEGNSTIVRYKALPVKKVEEQVTERNDIIFFPNPAKKTIAIQNNYTSPITAVNAYDITGKNVKVICSPSFHEINVSELNDGVYLFHVSFSNGQTFMQRVSIYN